LKVMAKGKFVSYLRVSTVKQGGSGLGLEAQREAVKCYLDGGRWNLIEEVVEVESGKKNDRPAISEALRLCRLHGAKLVIAKLDRLARNVHFISSLMESGVEFVAVDMPQANKLTIHIMAAMAEHEAEAISTRTREALKAARARGVKLGGQRGSVKRMRAMAEKGSQAAALARREAARKRREDLLPILAALQEAGCSTLQRLADGLNERKIPAPRGGSWSAAQVRRVLHGINTS
jgi:DNA invertase Pin-like site-specific DNA recombinase